MNLESRCISLVMAQRVRKNVGKCNEKYFFFFLAVRSAVMPPVNRIHTKKDRASCCDRLVNALRNYNREVCETCACGGV